MLDAAKCSFEGSSILNLVSLVMGFFLYPMLCHLIVLSFGDYERRRQDSFVLF